MEDGRLKKFKNDIQSEIETKINSWADLEIKIGEYTAEYKEDEANDFLFVYRNMKEKLNEYIKNQDSLVDISSVDAIKKDLNRFLFEFYFRFPTNTRSILNQIFYLHSGSVVYNFISFNYTSTLEKCVNLLPNPLRRRVFHPQGFNDKMAFCICMV